MSEVSSLGRARSKASNNNNNNNNINTRMQLSKSQGHINPFHTHTHTHTHTYTPGLYLGEPTLSSVSLVNSQEPPDIPDYLAKFDPLSLNVNLGIHNILEDFKAGTEGEGAYEGADFNTSFEDDDEEEEYEEEEEGEIQRGTLTSAKNDYSRGYHIARPTNGNTFNIFAENLVSMKFIKRWVTIILI